MTVPGKVFFGCVRPQMPQIPNPRDRVPEAGPDPGTSKFCLNAGNAAPARKSASTKYVHVTYQNAAFWMLVPATEPDVTILLQGVLEGR